MKHRIGIAALVVAATFSTTGVAYAVPKASGTWAGNVSAKVTAAAPSSDKHGRLKLDPSSKSAHGPRATVTVPDRIGGAVTISQGLGKSISVGLPKVGSGESAAVSTDGAAVFGESGDSASLAVQAFDGGARIATVITSDAGAEVFDYPVSLPEGGSLKLVPEGGALAIDGAGSLMAAFAPAWAKDASGREVKTSYEVRGSTLRQVVKHHGRGFSYPIVADPYYGIDLIDHASWSRQADGWIFEVTPTGWARAFPGSYWVGTYDWDELYTKYRYAGLNTNLNGMRDQLICHQEYVAIRTPNKATWNLDEWRPDVGYWDTVLSNCNPGGARWFD
ncbi:DUF2599 domain-containing protein [Arthrobacter sp. 2MCAF14]|uniref:DUF2599 domain-containing protein n=1 Tax=Arthrobacter sp. 2MCAF14 TaxID=3232982 RepID=UPI003F919655